MATPFTEIKRRLSLHFPGLSMNDALYAESEDNYICGRVEKEDSHALELHFRGRHGTFDVAYTVALGLDDQAFGVANPRITISCSSPASYTVDVFPTDDEVRVRAPQPANKLEVGKAVACIGLAGGKSAVECWYRCRTDVQCWKDCLKEKGVTFGIDITACLALS